MTAPTGPVFIGGLSHSGKTELRTILGAHPEVSMTRGSRLWERYYGRFGDLSERKNLDALVGAVLADPGAGLLGPDEARLRREFGAGPPTYARLFGLLHRHHAERLGKRRWGEQLGALERFAAPIFVAFPDAVIVHMVRDPVARYGEATGRKTGRRHRGALGWETARWLRSAALAERNALRYPGSYVVIRFESLAADPVRTAREICSLLGEPFTPEVAAAAASARFDDARERRRGTGGAREAAFVHRYARRALVALDYRTPPASLSARDRLPYLLKEWPVNRAAMAAWRVFAAPKQRAVR